MKTLRYTLLLHVKMQLIQMMRLKRMEQELIWVHIFIILVHCLELVVAEFRTKFTLFVYHG